MRAFHIQIPKFETCLTFPDVALELKVVCQLCQEFCFKCACSKIVLVGFFSLIRSKYLFLFYFY